MKKIKNIIGMIILSIIVMLPIMVKADIKENTKVLVWTTKIKINEEIESIEDRYYTANTIDEFAGYIEKNYTDEYKEKISVDKILGYDESIPEVKRTELPNLSEYSLVFIVLPSENPTDEEINMLKEYVNNGGRLVFIGENDGMANLENSVLSYIAEKLGAHFKIEEGIYGFKTVDEAYEQLKSERNNSSKLYSKGVEQAAIAPISYSGLAQWVYKVEDKVWVVDEAAGKGRITVISDINFLYSYYEISEDIETNPTEFMKLLLEDSINNIEIVKNGGNPNDGFGKGSYITKTDSEKVNISSLDLKNIIPLTEEEKKLVEEGIDVSVRLRVSESKEDVPQEDQKLINENLNNNTIAMFLDVSLFKKVGDNEETKLSLLTNKMELSVELSDEFINTDENKNRVYKVIRTHEGNVDIIDCAFDKETKTLTFETDRFSSYALVYEDKDIEVNPNTGDKALTYTILLAIGLFGIVAVVIYIKNNER